MTRTRRASGRAARRILPRAFFDRPALAVARDLLGMHLVRRCGPARSDRLVCRVVEVEAYTGPEDTACHAAKGRTERTEVMFGPAGIAYVYFTYGMHWLLNVVTERPDRPEAVLLRAGEPIEGIERMRALRGPRADRELTSGPAKLTLAMAIDGRLNRADMVRGRQLVFERGEPVPDADVARSPRIGIDYAAPSDRDAPWRLFVSGNRFVSRARPGGGGQRRRRSER